ncbi:cellulose binding domain-containing protein [Streptomyces sp. TRM 70361]|nr:cellulose binding domain-containing protein [Streptomyces sp. TRM 70361]MEE1941284.1 cellulose binding domain-containing protein [Streptomyces sp. TRM 70361]
MTVRNSGAAPLSGWTVRIVLADGGRITQVRNAALDAAGTAAGAATVRNGAWNGTLSAGDSTSFGFIASAGSASAAVDCAAGAV